MKSQEEMMQLAAQLRLPHGNDGVAVAQMMHDTNIGMTQHAIANLQLHDGDTVLELGHGNAAHLEFLLAQAPHLHYTGLDIAPLMYEEAQKVNAHLRNTAQFVLYDGGVIPFTDASFSAIFTVNTIYFWQDPIAMLQELYRVLLPGGRCCITFGEKRFMEQLPFTPFGFELYDIPKMKTLVASSPFKLQHTDTQQEWIKGKSGSELLRTFTTAVLVK